MSYVDVALASGPRSPLTYRLTPETLTAANPGVLVEVPVGSRQQLGIVWARRSRQPQGVRGGIRPVTQILSDGVWASAATRRLAKAIEAVTGASRGQTLARLLPPPSRRSNPGVRPSQPARVGQRFHLYGDHAQRRDQYSRLVARALSANQQVIIVAPQVRHRWLAEGLRQSQPSARVEIASAELTPTLQRQHAHDIATGLIGVLIGSRHVIGWPVHRLGLLIVDDVTHQAHHDEQSPYLDSSTLAWLRFRVEGGHLVLGSALPTLGLYQAERLGLAQAIRSASPQGLLTISQLLGPGLLLPATTEALRDTLARGGRVRVIAPSTGVAGPLVCRDCDRDVRCPTCHEPLMVIKPSQPLRCHRCQANHPQPATCPDCRSSQLRTRGLGVEAVRRELGQTDVALSQRVEVSTEGGLDNPGHVDLTVFSFADQPLASPDLGRAERFVMRIREALGQSQQVILQTLTPTNPWWQLLGKNWHQTVTQLVTERTLHHLPPTTRVLTLWGPSGPAPAPKLPASISVIRRQSGQSQQQIALLVPPTEWAPVRSAVVPHLPRAWRWRVGSILDEPSLGQLPSHAMIGISEEGECGSSW